MYQLDTAAGTVYSVHEQLAEALAEVVAAEHHERISNLYEAVTMSADAVAFFSPSLVAVA
ncbi:MAG TPA: hypothetical protein VNA12_08705 [Mycobacteriales bacterium]|nr:hypothetical protein [Mycobacteriales bacterium]